MSDIKEFKLPDVGEGLTEADIVRWHVQPGDTVVVNQIIVEIETAKAVVELPSPYAGVVADLLVAEGATADVGTPIISVKTGPGRTTATAPADVPAEAVVQRAISETEDLVPSPPVEGAIEPGIHGSPAPKAERQAVLVGYGVKLGTTSRRARKAAPGQPAAALSTARRRRKRPRRQPGLLGPRRPRASQRPRRSPPPTGPVRAACSLSHPSVSWPEISAST